MVNGLELELELDDDLAEPEAVLLCRRADADERSESMFESIASPVRVVVSVLKVVVSDLLVIVVVSVWVVGGKPPKALLESVLANEATVEVGMSFPLQATVVLMESLQEPVSQGLYEQQPVNGPTSHW